MSYTRSFRRTVYARYSGSKTVSYPASESGGSITVHYSGEAPEDVEVRIEVDTSPFDASIGNCNSHVNGLTASVGAMNAAQCAAIADHAEKVSTTIINGFFQSVRTDLSTQRAELEQKVEARLLLLRQQAQSLREKQRTMAEDYARTSARYQKIFNDLDKELSNRIHEVDRPVFGLVGDVDKQSDRMLHTEMVQTAVTMGKESSILQAQLGVATVKRDAAGAMGLVNAFLVNKAAAECTIRDSVVDGTGNDAYYLPVCVMQTKGEKGTRSSECVIPQSYPGDGASLRKSLMKMIDTKAFKARPDTRVRECAEALTAERLSGDDAHTGRVRALIKKFLGK